MVDVVLAIGIMSLLSSNPVALVARLADEGTTSNNDPFTAPPTGQYGCTLIPLLKTHQSSQKQVILQAPLSKPSAVERLV